MAHQGQCLNLRLLLLNKVIGTMLVLLDGMLVHQRVTHQRVIRTPWVDCGVKFVIRTPWVDCGVKFVIRTPWVDCGVKFVIRTPWVRLWS